MKINKSTANRLVRPLSLLLCIAVALAMILIPAGAAETADLDAPVSLTVTVGTEEMAEGLAGAKIVVDVYRLAEATMGADGVELVPAAACYEGQDFKAEDSEDVRALANALLLAAVEKDTPVVKGAEVDQLLSTVTLTKDDEGKALTSGLYMVVIRGSDINDGYVTSTVDAEGNVNLATYAVNDTYQYLFLPQLINLPMDIAELEMYGFIKDENSTAKGFIYDLTINIKPEISTKEGGVDILKTLLTYETSQPVYFVFRIDAIYQGQMVYSDVKTLEFTAAGQQKVHLDGLPIGAEVTVTEVYSGASYKLVTDEVQKTVVGAGAFKQVDFINDYDYKTNGGGAVENRFTYMTGSGWNWKPYIEIEIND